MKTNHKTLGEIILARFAAHGLAGYALANLNVEEVGGAFEDAMIHALASERGLPPDWELDFDESDKIAGEAAEQAGQSFFCARREHMIYRKLGI